MEVSVQVVTLTIEGRKRLLTKSMAKQFPMRRGSQRIDLAFRCKPRPAALCKVLDETLVGREGRGWLVLCDDPVAGLAWYRPVAGDHRLEQDMLDRGSWIDILADIPTVVLP